MEVRSATGENMRARRGKIDVIVAIIDAVGRAAVTGGHGDRDAERGGRLTGRVERAIAWAVQLISGEPQEIEMTLGLCVVS